MISFSPATLSAAVLPQRGAHPAHLSQGDRIMHDQISEGSMIFVSDGDEGIGSVREIRHGLPELLVYIENAGEHRHSAVRT